MFDNINDIMNRVKGLLETSNENALSTKNTEEYDWGYCDGEINAYNMVLDILKEYVEVN